MVMVRGKGRGDNNDESYIYFWSAVSVALTRLLIFYFAVFVTV